MERFWVLRLTVFLLAVLLLITQIGLPVFVDNIYFSYPVWLIVQGFIFFVFFLLLILVFALTDRGTNRSTSLGPGLEEEDSGPSPGRLIGTIVHELRRPLARLKLRLGKLVGDEGLPEIPEELQEVEQTVSRVENVFQKEQFSPRWIFLPRLVGLLTSDYKKIDDLQFIPGFEWIYCDPYQIKMALSNLIRNSRQAYGEAQGKIELRADRYGPEWCLSVSDSAGGMDRNLSATIGGRGRPLDFSGMGLGLILVKKICRNHRGRLLIESVPEEGTTVTMVLPIQRTRG